MFGEPIFRCQYTYFVQLEYDRIIFGVQKYLILREIVKVLYTF